MENLLVITERSDWHWILTAECALALKKLGENVSILELLPKFEENSTVSSKESELILKIEELLNYKNIEICKKAIKRRFKIFIKIKHFAYFDEGYSIQKFAFASLVAILQKWQINIFKIKNLYQVLNIMSIAKSYHYYLSTGSWRNVDRVYVVNGRFVRNATVKGYFDDQGITTKVIEFGSGRNRLKICSLGAQSIEEHESMTINSWESADLEVREEIARAFFVARRKKDPISGISWTAGMTPNFIPKLGVKKKTCVFYATSQIEFAGNALENSDIEFKSQDDALLAILELLDDKDWQILLRKHPKARDHSGWSDSEDQLEKSINSSKLTIIEADSPVDSYALAARADLVVTYGSSIGPEIVYAELAPVISLCNTNWKFCSPDRHATNRKELKELLEKELPIIDGKEVLPWGYFAATSGDLFKYFEVYGSSWRLKLNKH